MNYILLFLGKDVEFIFSVLKPWVAKDLNCREPFSWINRKKRMNEAFGVL